MRKIITITGLLLIAAIAIAWSALDRAKTAGKEAGTGTPATISPADITAIHGKNLPAEYWDAF
jgi:hypothetical protein